MFIIWKNIPEIESEEKINLKIDAKANIGWYKSKEEGKDQESIQSCTTPDLGHHMGNDKNTRKHITQESKEVSPLPAGDHKAARSS